MLGPSRTPPAAWESSSQLLDGACSRRPDNQQVDARQRAASTVEMAVIIIH